MQVKCIFCGANVQLVHVHGHYQCPACKTNALPCCDGDNCGNFLLTAAAQVKNNAIDPAHENRVNTGTKGSNK